MMYAKVHMLFPLTRCRGEYLRVAGILEMVK